ncbi:MAG: trypsin-like peptidase domain-containing protein [Isosphaeraceae bacterium]
MAIWYYLGPALLAGAIHLTPAADDPFPEGMVVLRAQPSVFLVTAIIDLEAEYPRSGHAEPPGHPARTSAGPMAARRRPTPTGAWILLGSAPDKYLVVPAERARAAFPNALKTRGSAVAVSHEGILLTNAHVVADSVERSSPEYWTLILESIDADLLRFEGALGRPKLGQADFEKVRAGIFGWYSRKVEVVAAKIRSHRVVLDYKAPLADAASLLRRRSVLDAVAARPREISVPATVLAMGEPLPGKDIAVLKVTFAAEEQARLAQKNRENPLPAGTLEAWLREIQDDRLICLPLGNSEDLLPQDRLQALGMPDIAFNAAAMDPEAFYKVSARGGQVSQTKRMKGGWDILEMTVPIDHGDSGGPVLDSRGRVVAINVGAAREGPGALKLAIPINVAREFLAKAGVKPDPGPLSALWEKAVRLYARGEYQACYDQVQAVIRMQKGDPLANREDREASYYARDLAGRCLQKLGKIPGGN